MATNTIINPLRVEAPVTFKAYLMCAFAAFGGIFFGYDSGYINGVMGMHYFIHVFTGKSYPGPSATPEELSAFSLPASKKSLIVSILSAGTFFGALIAGDLADMIGRKFTIIMGCAIFSVGVALQTAATAYGLLIAGRLVAGFGVGFVSAVIILYMSEIAPKKVRGAMVSGYQFCITIGILLASCVTYGTQNYQNSGAYRIPIAIQLLWAIILGKYHLPPLHTSSTNTKPSYRSTHPSRVSEILRQERRFRESHNSTCSRPRSAT